MQACDTTTRKISIHALREEGDKSDGGRRPHRQNFYPRPPRGGRHSNWVRFLTKRIISIHALREEGDQFFFDRARAALQFLSTPSARRATRIAQRKDDLAGDFYPRPPRGGRPSRVATDYIEESISIHALREEGDSSVIRLPELS